MKTPKGCRRPSMVRCPKKHLLCSSLTSDELQYPNQSVSSQCRDPRGGILGMPRSPIHYLRANCCTFFQNTKASDHQVREMKRQDWPTLVLHTMKMFMLQSALRQSTNGNEAITGRLSSLVEEVAPRLVVIVDEPCVGTGCVTSL